MSSEAKVKVYTGTMSVATNRFQNAKSKNLELGYIATEQNYEEGSRGGGIFIIGLFLLPVFGIGLFVWIYALLVKPEGRLIVTYEKIKSSDIDTKECPKCAEIIKLKAKVCRFCDYKF